MFTHGPLERRAAWTRPLAVCLALALIAPPAAQLLPTAQAQGAPAPLTAAGIKSVLLFPAGAATSAGAPALALGPRLDDAIRTRLTLVGVYKTTTYTKFLPSVQRGVSESDSGSGLTDADTRSPFGPGDGARAQRIASLVGTDAYLLTSVASYSQDAATRRVTVLINSRVFDSRSGAAVPGLGGTFSGTAGPITPTDTDAVIEQGAINDAASRVTSSLNAAATSHGAPMVVPSSKRGGTDRTGEYALGAILLGIAVAAIISGSHFGGGGGGSTSSGTNGGSTSSGSTTTTIPAIPGPPTQVPTGAARH